ncbi:hypothetical protein VPH35_008613 [Triticum aestivum]
MENGAVELAKAMPNANNQPGAVENHGGEITRRTLTVYFIMLGGTEAWRSHGGHSVENCIVELEGRHRHSLHQDRGWTEFTRTMPVVFFIKMEPWRMMPIIFFIKMVPCSSEA